MGSCRYVCNFVFKVSNYKNYGTTPFFTPRARFVPSVVNYPTYFRAFWNIFSHGLASPVN